MSKIIFGIIFIIGGTAWFYDLFIKQEEPAQHERMQTIQIIGPDAPGNEQLIERAVRLLFKECPGFERYKADFIDGKAYAAPDLDQGQYRSYLVEWFGWTDYVGFTVTVREDVQRIPRSFNADGHTLYFYIGAGKQPGIVGKKLQSQKVCGSLPQDSSRDTFFSVPEAQFIEALH